MFVPPEALGLIGTNKPQRFTVSHSLFVLLHGVCCDLMVQLFFTRKQVYSPASRGSVIGRGSSATGGVVHALLIHCFPASQVVSIQVVPFGLHVCSVLVLRHSIVPAEHTTCGSIRSIGVIHSPLRQVVPVLQIRLRTVPLSQMVYAVEPRH